MRHTACVFPEEHGVRAVVSTGAFDVVIGRFDELGNFAGERRVVGGCNFRVAATLFAQVFIFVVNDLSPQIGSCVVICRENKGGEERGHQCKHKQKNKQALVDPFHADPPDEISVFGHKPYRDFIT